VSVLFSVLANFFHMKKNLATGGFTNAISVTSHMADERGEGGGGKTWDGEGQMSDTKSFRGRFSFSTASW